MIHLNPTHLKLSPRPGLRLGGSCGPRWGLPPGSPPLRAIVDLFNDLEKLPQSNQSQTEHRDVCLGFCFGPLCEMGYLYANHRCFNAGLGLVCRQRPRLVCIFPEPRSGRRMQPTASAEHRSMGATRGNPAGGRQARQHQMNQRNSKSFFPNTLPLTPCSSGNCGCISAPDPRRLCPLPLAPGFQSGCKLVPALYLDLSDLKGILPWQC